MILIIEDNENDQAVTERVLAATVPNVRRRVARTAQEALIELKDSSVADSVRLILLDMHLPGQSGLKLLEELALHEEMTGIPVVVISDSTAEADLKRAYELGARSVLMKPVGFDEYCEMLRTACIFWLQMNLSTNDSRVLKTELRH